MRRINGRNVWNEWNIGDEGQIADDSKAADVISSFDLARNPLSAMSRLIDDFIYPMRLKATEAKKILAYNLELPKFYDKTKMEWSADWLIK